MNHHARFVQHRLLLPLITATALACRHGQSPIPLEPAPKPAQLSDDLSSRLVSLENAFSKIYFASVNHTGTVTAGNLPNTVKVNPPASPGTYNIDFSNDNVYDAVIVVSAVSSDGQPTFVNAGNDPAAPNSRIVVRTWGRPSLGNNYYFKGDYEPKNANFRLAMVVPSKTASQPSGDMQTRLRALEASRAAIYFASVNARCTVADGNLGKTKVLVSNAPGPSCIVDFSSEGDIYDAPILVGTTTPDGYQPLFINAGNDSAHPFGRFTVFAWSGPNREGMYPYFHYKGYNLTTTNFRFVVFRPNVWRRSLPEPAVADSAEARIASLERSAGAFVYASVNANGKVAAGNLPVSAAEKGPAGVYYIDYTKILQPGDNVYDAVIIASAVSNDGQPVFITAGNDPKAPYSRFLVNTWRRPDLDTSTAFNGVHRGDYKQVDANFKVVIFQPHLWK